MRGVSSRTAFLIENGTIRQVWELGGELPDIDAVLEAAGRIEDEASAE
jgi:peroxiredoxin